MKKSLLSLLIFSIFLSCSTTNNNFSKEANKFLDAVDGRTYNGENTGAGLTFKANGRVFAINGTPNSTFRPDNALYFINSRNGGASSSEAIYQENLAPERYIGIIITDGAKKIWHTDYAPSAETINWNVQPFQFGTRR
ncbi:MAG: hypothetical protein ACRCTJ_07525 [Brevinema sp.]